MGKLLTKRSFIKNGMMSTFKAVWRITRDVEIQSIEDNLFLFKFVNLIDKQRILDGSLGTYDRHLLLLQDFDGDKRPSNFSFMYAPFWVRVFDLPLNIMSRPVAESLGAKMVR